MEIIWSEEAAVALLELELELFERFPNQVDDIIDDILRRVALLEDNPELGRMVPEYESKKIRELVDEHIRILYWLRNGQIEILTIVPGRSLIPSASSD